MAAAALRVSWSELSVTKQRAFEDAKKMQKAVVEECAKSGKEVPQYHLSELIGKGSFGRVYKATAQKTGRLVAVKIIDIEESDTANPRMADTYNDLLKEINALKLLSNSGARNINHVIEALPVGHAMWMITEYCAGGSVATLMKPTVPDGLQEKWVIPILREVAEAMFWVHGQGIIHRDLKCANVLVTEIGDVQLCDFGVAGVIETKFDKRTTVIGTPNWMAPELLDQTASYGTEVDIWAFGAMVYEIASGLPPNVTDRIDFSQLRNRLKQQTPRLEGDKYSSSLKDLVAYCLQHEPAKRPSIEQVQRHGYLYQTEEAYPTHTLAHLVRGFKMWEAQGGDRRSLFAAGGAQGLADISSTALANDEWNFSTTAAFDQQVLDSGQAQEVFDAYGSNVDFSEQSFEETSRPAKPKSRRRPPPQLPSVKAPLEKVFDPNTISNYEDNSRAYYGRLFMPPPSSDLPLRDESASAADVRESLIDLDASLHGSDLSHFVDLNTIRASDSRASIGDDPGGDSANVRAAPSSDPADGEGNRRTRDWKFPTMATPASAKPEMFRFPLPGEAEPATPDTSRPPLAHHQTEPPPFSMVFSDSSSKDSAGNRASVGSLIDLDMSFADSSTEYTRPSTSHSDVGSISGSDAAGANPFELEKHASLYPVTNTNREPSIYVSDDSEYATAVVGNSASDGEVSLPPPIPPLPQAAPAVNEQPANGIRPYSLSEFADMDPQSMSPPTTHAPVAALPPASLGDSQPPPPPPPPLASIQEQLRARSSTFNYASLPPAPTGPSSLVMEGRASTEDVKSELRRMAMSLGDHLSHANWYLSGLPVRNGTGTRLEPLAGQDE